MRGRVADQIVALDELPTLRALVAAHTVGIAPVLDIVLAHRRCLDPAARFTEVLLDVATLCAREDLVRLDDFNTGFGNGDPLVDPLHLLRRLDQQADLVLQRHREWILQDRRPVCINKNVGLTDVDRPHLN